MQDISTPAVDTGGPAGSPVFTSDQMLRLRKVLTRSPYYVDDNAWLRFSVTSSQGQIVTVTFAWRNATLDGKVQVNSVQLTTAAGQVTVNQDVYLGEGLLYNITATSSSGPITTFSVFAQAKLLNGQGINALVVATFCASYITSLQPVAWPGTPLRNSKDGPGVTSAVQNITPGLGTEAQVIVPAFTVWKLNSVHFLYNPSAVVANRIPILVVKLPSGNVVFQIATTQVITASIGNNLAWLAGGSFGPIVTTDISTMAIPVDCFLEPGASVNTVTIGMDPGDFYGGGTVRFQEWLQVT